MNRTSLWAKSPPMLLRLLRPLLAILIAFSMIAAPTVQAAAIPCDTMQMVSDRQVSNVGAQHSVPCEVTPACLDALGCVAIASLPVPAISAARPLAFAPVAYWTGTDTREGLSVEPALNPPIPFA
ncbi:hypothetical protein [Muricoccus nepalensis]|nr:hypothetical protein [Roseomonas nepalensis]